MLDLMGCNLMQSGLSTSVFVRFIASYFHRIPFSSKNPKQSGTARIMRNWSTDALTELREGNKYTVTLDDDVIVAPLIQEILNIKTHAFTSASEFLSKMDRLNPVAVFVDVHLAGGECGLDIVPQIKARWPEAPILVLTSDASESLVGQALAAGADDFIRKPIRPGELVGRLMARKNEIDLRNNQTILRFGDLVLDLRNKTLSGMKGNRFQSPREAEILSYLIQVNGTIVDKATLRRRIWGNVVVSDNAIDRKLFEVRTAIKDVSDSVEILSVYGQGIALRQRLHPAAPSSAMGSH